MRNAFHAIEILVEGGVAFTAFQKAGYSTRSDFQQRNPNLLRYAIFIHINCSIWRLYEHPQIDLAGIYPGSDLKEGRREVALAQGVARRVGYRHCLVFEHLHFRPLQEGFLA